MLGEVALIDPSSKRTANVISDGHVTCMTLCRSEFHQLLKGLEVALMEHQALRGAGTGKKKTNVPNRRRISGFDGSGARSEVRSVTLLRRMSRFMTESYWNSLYARFYRNVLLSPQLQEEAGSLAEQILLQHPTHVPAVEAIRNEVCRILQLDVARRTHDDSLFIAALLRTKNHFRSKLCHLWPETQFNEICKKFRFVSAKSMRKVRGDLVRLFPGERLIGWFGVVD